MSDYKFRQFSVDGKKVSFVVELPYGFFPKLRVILHATASLVGESSVARLVPGAGHILGNVRKSMLECSIRDRVNRFRAGNLVL